MDALYLARILAGWDRDLYRMADMPVIPEGAYRISLLAMATGLS